MFDCHAINSPQAQSFREGLDGNFNEKRILNRPTPANSLYEPEENLVGIWTITKAPLFEWS